MKTMILFLSLMFACLSFSQDRKIINCNFGDTFIAEPQSSKNTESQLYVCDSKAGIPRGISRGELFKMYNATKNEPGAYDIWGKIAEASPATPDNILKMLQKVPKDELIYIGSKDPMVLDIANQWYQMYAARIAERPPKTVSPTDYLKYIGRQNAREVGLCISNGGEIPVDLSGTKPIGCTCDNITFKNHVDFKCERYVDKDKKEKRRIVPNPSTSTDGGGTSAPQTEGRR